MCACAIREKPMSHDNGYNTSNNYENELIYYCYYFHMYRLKISIEIPYGLSRLSVILCVYVSVWVRGVIELNLRIVQKLTNLGIKCVTVSIFALQWDKIYTTTKRTEFNCFPPMCDYFFSLSLSLYTFSIELYNTYIIVMWYNNKHHLNLSLSISWFYSVFDRSTWNQ